MIAIFSSGERGKGRGEFLKDLRGTDGGSFALVFLIFLFTALLI